MSDIGSQTSLDVAFSRDGMIPPAPPPLSERGLWRWLRNGILAGPLNVALTIVALWVVWAALSNLVPWAWRGIWVADNLSECRAIRDELYGPGVPAACWAVITDRWRQLTFGFYPAAGTWRPVVALALFLVAVLPVLFSDLSRRLLWLTAAAPFAIVWLLWGGSIWGPATVALGIAVAAMAAREVGRRAGGLWGFATGAAILVALFMLPGPSPLAPLREVLAAALPVALEPVQSDRFGGFTLSITIGVAAICLSLPLGVLLALARASDLLVVSAVATAYIEVIRGVPLIVWLFVAQLLLAFFLPPTVTIDLLLRVIVMMTLFASAYIAEVVRGGLASLPKGQSEGAESLGLSYWQSMRLIVLPQALKVSIPGIVNTFIGLFKDTTLVAFIALLDPIGLARGIRANTDWQGIYWELYVFIAAVFFVFCFAMSRYSMWLERRLERGHR